MITESLHWALRRFRATGWQMIWVDQMCIDQSNVKERSQQVQLMKSIYESSTMTYAYLGEGSCDSRHGVELLKLICLTADVCDQVRRPLTSPHILDMIRQHPGWNYMLEIFSVPYFRRTWIIQEVAISPVIKITYAGVKLEWKDLIRAASKTTEIFRAMGDGDKSKEADEEFMYGNNATGALSELRRQVKWSKDTGGRITPLIGLLMDTSSKNSEATDPRDRIYGLLSLAGDVNLLPRPDYTKSVEEIFIDFARVLYRTGRGILTAAGSDNQVLKLPSWVPDWTQTFHNINRWIGPNREPFIGNTNIQDGAVQAHFRGGNNPNDLMIQGVELDTIALTGLEMPDNSLQPGTEWFFDFSTWDEVAKAMLLEAETMAGCVNMSERIDNYAKFLAVDAPARYSSASPGPGRLRIYEGFNILDFDTSQVTSGDVAGDVYSKMQEYVEQISSPNGGDVDKLASVYWGKVKANIARKAFGITTKGYIALIPPSTMIGDLVMIVPSFRNPFVMRQLEGAYQLVGDCFVGELDPWWMRQLNEVALPDIVLR